MYIKHAFFFFLCTSIHGISSNEPLTLTSLMLSLLKQKQVLETYVSGISISIFTAPSFVWSCTVKCSRAFRYNIRRYKHWGTNKPGDADKTEPQAGAHHLKFTANVPPPTPWLTHKRIQQTWKVNYASYTYWSIVCVKAEPKKDSTACTYKYVMSTVTFLWDPRRTKSIQNQHSPSYC